ncbi:hypothetical protein WJX82_001653 [Trebouxia sp. C0006]
MEEPAVRLFTPGTIISIQKKAPVTGTGSEWPLRNSTAYLRGQVLKTQYRDMAFAFMHKYITTYRVHPVSSLWTACAFSGIGKASQAEARKEMRECLVVKKVTSSRTAITIQNEGCTWSSCHMESREE